MYLCAGEWLALELLGPHNAIKDTRKPKGDALFKWRLLTARGYQVVLIDQWTWQRLRAAADRDERLIYLQKVLRLPKGISSSRQTPGRRAVSSNDGSLRSSREGGSADDRRVGRETADRVPLEVIRR